MKRTITLILCVMSFAAMAVAQDVYFSCTREGEQGYYAAVYKNDELLYSGSGSSSYYHDAGDVLFYDGNVYWVDNCVETDYQFHYGYVYRNDELFLAPPIGSNSVIVALFTDGNDVYAAGQMFIDGIQSLVVWKNDDASPYLVFDGGTWLYDAMIADGVVYACGEVIGETGLEGIIWKEGCGEWLNFGDQIPCALAFYDGDVYTAVRDIYGYIKVFKNSTELYGLGDLGSVSSISIDAGDVYVLGSNRNSTLVWKNGIILYETPWCTTYFIEANSEGVFYSINGSESRIWKDGAPLYVFEEWMEIMGISVGLDCHNNEVRTLPYFEGFETGQTDWICWNGFDEDNQNNGYASYWHRGGENYDVSPATGQHCAWHKYNSEYEQQGRLLSPLISIPAGDNVMLSFKTYEEYPEDYGYEGVWVHVDGQKDCEEVWTQTEPSNEWKTVTIDLSTFKGQEISIDFRYSGFNGHSWYIDDVSVMQTVSVVENEVDAPSVYPNPANDRIFIEGLEVDSEVQLFNALGELVKTIKVDANNEINITELASGLYLVCFGNASARFVKE